jgi:hypothetical protein
MKRQVAQSVQVIRWAILALALPVIGCGFSGCDAAPSGRQSHEQSSPQENITHSERAEAAKLTPAEDAVSQEIYAFRLKTRGAYNNRRFDELDALAAELRKEKPLFGNGSWRIVQFYGAFELNDDETEEMWKEHERIHQQWIAANPTSVTARVAYADFLTSYAWQARGSGFADSVTDAAWHLFGERLAAAGEILKEGRELPEKDPMWWMVALRLALGQGWPKEQYNAMLEEAVSFEPKFWGYHTTRAYSLLPRWHGQPGDWEAYAEQAAERPDGLGAEVYARIVIRLRGFHDNVFGETKASWPKTREGLEIMLKKYPDSLEIASNAARLASIAQDREMAQQMFARIGDQYLPSVWRKPERFVHCRNWAMTGQW